MKRLCATVLVAITLAACGGGGDDPEETLIDRQAFLYELIQTTTEPLRSVYISEFNENTKELQGIDWWKACDGPKRANETVAKCVEFRTLMSTPIQTP